MDKEPRDEAVLHRTPPPPYTPKPEMGSAHPQQPPIGFAHYGDANQPTPTITVVHAIQLDNKSQMIHCGQCGVQSMTKTKIKPNTLTHTVALILFCFICWPCAWIPYACDSCQSIHHYCSNCNAYIGEYRSQ